MAYFFDDYSWRFRAVESDRSFLVSSVFRSSFSWDLLLKSLVFSSIAVQQKLLIAQCYEKFLMYGYAAEYKTFQQKILAERAPKALFYGLCLLLSGLCPSCC